jgi:hypothetical protein
MAKKAVWKHYFWDMKVPSHYSKTPILLLYEDHLKWHKIHDSVIWETLLLSEFGRDTT